MPTPTLPVLPFTFEERFPYFEISGNAHLHEGPIPAPNIGTTDSARAIQTGQDWYIHATWTCSGWMTNAMSGDWQIQVFLEKMGIGEFELMPGGPVTIPFVSANPHTYSTFIPFVATSLSVPKGLYKPTLQLTMEGPAGVALPIVAVAEGDVISFYDVGP